MDYHSSTATPAVQGFTPINQSSPSVIPSESVPITTTAGNGKDNGKKRPRKTPKLSSATPKATKGPRQKQSKKAKRLATPDDQDISKTFTITKPHANDHLFRLERSKDLALGGFGEADSQRGILHVDDPLGTTHIEDSPATVIQSPFSRGLGSIYQAAFRNEEQKQRAELDSESPLFGTLCDDDASPFDPAAREHGSASTVVDTIHGQTALFSLGHGAFDSIVQIPCSPGILTDAEHIKPELGEYADMATSLACSGDDVNGPLDWQAGVRQAENTALPNMEVARVDNNTGHSDRHEMEEDSMDIDDAEFSLLMSKFTNAGGESPKGSPEHPVGPVDFSLSSDPDQSVSSFGDDTKVSSGPTFIESSSPYLQSLSDPQPSTGKGKVLKESFLDVEEQSFEEETYNDDDLEAVLQCFDSPTSAQMPPRSVSISPIQELPTLPQRAASTYNTMITSLSNSPGPTKQDMAPPALPSATRASIPNNIPHKVSFDQAGNPIPFIRPPFPVPVRDRSPVIGLGSQTVLRACFRIGEALNAGSTALRTKQDAVIELYARVVHSERPPGSVKQHFQFADIFSPDKPPFLKGTYGLWKGVELWDKDSKVFLGEKGKGKMARVVGRMVRDEKTRGLELTMLSVWEADWEDVGICKGHYCG
ncbi:MAG: hypothetical protein Q9208_000267 [Pyrenodesmia sp. 3 TL-2023]